MIVPSLEELEKAEAIFLIVHGWKPVPKPRGAENDPEVPQWWATPNPKDEEQKEFEQGDAVRYQKMKLVTERRINRS